MREILFRGKSIDTGKWIEGFYNYFDYIYNGREVRRNYILPTYEQDSIVVDPATVGQYTGMKDKKNGKKIFEGDIVLGRFEFGMKVPSLVVFRDGAFGLAWGHSGKNFFTSFTGFCNVTFEVIGNVFDSPELLNKEF